jgi:hypothetical protein
MRQSLECGEHAVRARIHVDRRYVAPPDDAVRIDDEQRAFTDAVVTPVGTIGAGDRPLWLEVGEQREAQVLGFLEGAVTPDAVHRDAEERGAEPLKFGEHFIEQRDLVATDRTPVGGVEDEDHGMPALIRQAKA